MTSVAEKGSNPLGGDRRAFDVVHPGSTLRFAAVWFR